MSKIKIREITIEQSKGTFSIFKKVGTSKENYDFEGLSALRKLLSNEKARLLHICKTKEPAKKLGRTFQSVNYDIKFLERFGFIDLIEEKTKIELGINLYSQLTQLQFISTFNFHNTRLF